MLQTPQGILGSRALHPVHNRMLRLSEALTHFSAPAIPVITECEDGEKGRQNHVTKSLHKKQLFWRILQSMVGMASVRSKLVFYTVKICFSYHSVSLAQTDQVNTSKGMCTKPSS